MFTFPTPSSSDGWRRARRCSPKGDNCVEINLSRTGLSGVRDSKRSDGACLIFKTDSLTSFVQSLRDGRR